MPGRFIAADDHQIGPHHRIVRNDPVDFCEYVGPAVGSGRIDRSLQQGGNIDEELGMTASRTWGHRHWQPIREFPSALPLLHRDPFDRLLVPQARTEPLILLTNDPVLVQYGTGVELIRQLAKKSFQEPSITPGTPAFCRRNTAAR